MHAKTMEGLVGASTNMDMVNVPMRVFKEARRKGNTAIMERAMNYACEFTERAEEYKTKADEGMKEEAEEAREKVKAQQERAIEKRRKEREKMQEQLEKNQATKEDTVEVSAQGKLLLEDTIQSDTTISEAINANSDKEPVIYTKTAEAGKKETASSISVFV